MPIINQIVKGSGGGGSFIGIQKAIDANGVLQNGSTFIDLSGATDIGYYALSYVYFYNTNISGVFDMSSVKKISGQNACNTMCAFASGITSVDLSSLEEISGMNACSYAFQNCTGITSINVGSLKRLNGSCNYMFSGCSNLTSVDMSGLEVVISAGACEHMFATCSRLVSADLSSLVSITQNIGCQNMFINCSALSSVDVSSLKNLTGTFGLFSFVNNCPSISVLSFPSLTPDSFGTANNQLNDMLKNVSGCTVHFPSNIQSTIGSWASVTGGFGGTNTTVLFDLPSTAHLTGADTVEYERNPKYDTQTALAWRVNDTGTAATPVIDWTPFYTSGTTDPQVGDTIYSDSACTTAVTTISSIA